LWKTRRRSTFHLQALWQSIGEMAMRFYLSDLRHRTSQQIQTAKKQKILEEKACSPN